MTRIKDIPLNERPREKALRNGISSLSNVELLAVLLSSGTKNHPVIEIAYDLLKRYGSIEGLFKTSIDELQKVEGISLARAVRLASSFELIRRYEKELKSKRAIIDNSEDAIKILLNKSIGLENEEVFLVLLNDKCELIRIETLFVGTRDSVPLSASDILRAVVRSGAKRVIIAHNHPSGNIKPSKDDLRSYEAINLFLSTCGIDLIDSLILGSQKSYSCGEARIIINSQIIDA